MANRADNAEVRQRLAQLHAMRAAREAAERQSTGESSTNTTTGHHASTAASQSVDFGAFSDPPQQQQRSLLSLQHTTSESSASAASSEELRQEYQQRMHDTSAEGVVSVSGAFRTPVQTSANAAQAIGAIQEQAELAVELEADFERAALAEALADSAAMRVAEAAAAAEAAPQPRVRRASTGLPSAPDAGHEGSSSIGSLLQELQEQATHLQDEQAARQAHTASRQTQRAHFSSALRQARDRLAPATTSSGDAGGALLSSLRAQLSQRSSTGPIPPQPPAAGSIADMFMNPPQAVIGGPGSAGIQDMRAMLQAAIAGELPGAPPAFVRRESGPAPEGASHWRERAQALCKLCTPLPKPEESTKLQEIKDHLTFLADVANAESPQQWSQGMFWPNTPR